ncbi:MAG: hypothetical protein ACRDRJ_46700, partial [Streptosporangiaceae bacterium]
TAIADSLVAAGLARRETEPGDRRVVRLHLTEAGTAAVQRADAAYADWMTRLFELTGDGERIRADLRLISTALDELCRTRPRAACAPAPGAQATPAAATQAAATRAAIAGRP